MIDSSTAEMIMRSELSTLPVHKGGTRSTDIAIRCPYCGDSKKDPRDAHFYIKCKPDERDSKVLFSYNCFLCNKKSKVMSIEVAKKIGITESNLLEYIASINNMKQSDFKKSGTNVIANKLNYTIDDVIKSKTADEDMRYKKIYLWKRLHWKDICVNPEKYKIVLNLRQFFMQNKLQPNMDYGKYVKPMLNNLHTNGIGFVSFDNTHINFRDITPNPERRYTQYLIYPKRRLNKNGVAAETSGIYMVPTNVDIMSQNLKLVMAEGPFDILRIYSDFYKATTDPNIIFASVANSHGYQACITKLLEYGMMFDEIEIYSDIDVNIEYYKRSIKPTVPDAKLIIHYNKKSKDVGDVREPCELSTLTL